MKKNNIDYSSKYYVNFFNSLKKYHLLSANFFYHITFSIIQNNDNKNSVNLCSLINDGDLIEIGGNEYEVDTITYNTFAQCDVTFFANTGLTFNENHIKIDPFIDYLTHVRHYSVLDGML